MAASIPDKEHLMVTYLLNQGHAPAVRLYNKELARKARTLVSSDDAWP